MIPLISLFQNFNGYLSAVSSRNFYQYDILRHECMFYVNEDDYDPQKMINLPYPIKVDQR